MHAKCNKIKIIFRIVINIKIIKIGRTVLYLTYSWVQMFQTHPGVKEMYRDEAYLLQNHRGGQDPQRLRSYINKQEPNRL
jgi:hypothetical protein